MKIYLLKYKFTLEKVVFEDEMIVPAAGKPQARFAFHDITSRAYGLIGSFKGKRILYPLRAADSKLEIVGVEELK